MFFRCYKTQATFLRPLLPCALVVPYCTLPFSGLLHAPPGPGGPWLSRIQSTFCMPLPGSVCFPSPSRKSLGSIPLGRKLDGISRCEVTGSGGPVVWHLAAAAYGGHGCHSYRGSRRGRAPGLPLSAKSQASLRSCPLRTQCQQHTDPSSASPRGHRC